jgi:hypothetical protein
VTGEGLVGVVGRGAIFGGVAPTSVGRGGRGGGVALRG